MSENKPKQVIVIRRDLKMRRGKEIAQGSHASMAFLSNRMWKVLEDGLGHRYSMYLSTAESEWLYNEKFTKITLQVDTEADLLKVYEDAKAAALEVNLITDSGATEFHGVPTNTCLAIGPDWSDKIDAVTSTLRLY